jgi:hypothetical protein
VRRRRSVVRWALVVVSSCVAMTTATLGGGGVALADAAPACAPGWNAVPFANPAGVADVSFSRVAARGLRVWAMGTLIERWNGTAWRVVPGPALQPDESLTGLGLVGRRGALVVGRGGDRLLALRWNGDRWSRLTLPEPPLDEFEFGPALLDVSVNSTNDIWLTGTIYHEDGTNRAFFEHWNGSGWTIAPGDPGGAYLLPAHSAPSDVWAVGGAGKDYFFASIAHWDGTVWTGMAAADFADSTGSFLTGVTAVSTNDVWAVGNGTTLDTVVPLAEHWDGASWRLVATPTLSPGATFSDVAALGPHRVWAVGQNHGDPLVERWTRAAWRVIPLPRSWAGGFASATVDGAGSVWAVGSLIARHCTFTG